MRERGLRVTFQIDEVGINLRVEDDGRGARDRSKKKKKKKDEARRARSGCCGFDREEVIDDCVRRVLQALRAMEER